MGLQPGQLGQKLINERYEVAMSDDATVPVDSMAPQLPAGTTTVSDPAIYYSASRHWCGTRKEA